VIFTQIFDLVFIVLKRSRPIYKRNTSKFFIIMACTGDKCSRRLHSLGQHSDECVFETNVSVHISDGEILIDIRDFFVQDGDGVNETVTPTSTGIALSIEQWFKLTGGLWSIIDQEIAKAKKCLEPKAADNAPNDVDHKVLKDIF
jgi:hypothetical protein